MVPSERTYSTAVTKPRERRVKMSKAHSASRIVAYLPSLKTILLRLRATSATPSSLSSTLLATATPLTTTFQTWAHMDEYHSQHPGTDHVLSYPSITAQFTLHPSLPLPGAVGVATPETTPSQSTLDNVDTMPISHKVGGGGDTPTSFAKDKPHEVLECVAQSIPDFLVADLMLLFPGVSIKGEGLNVITLSQRTVNDMTAWSADVEQEREQLLEHFVDSAKEICSRLTGAGYWADFVDPSSGRAYYSAYSNATLFETDDRFRYFGFDIIDLGCCKCVHHPVWGAFTFVGIIFTSAPTNSNVIQTIMEL